MGLALQTFNDGVTGSEKNNSSSPLEGVTEELNSACPIHSALLAALNAATVTSGGITSELEGTFKPIDRYLAEGIEERYALLSVSDSDTGGESPDILVAFAEKTDDDVQ